MSSKSNDRGWQYWPISCFKKGTNVWEPTGLVSTCLMQGYDSLRNSRELIQYLAEFRSRYLESVYHTDFKVPAKSVKATPLNLLHLSLPYCIVIGQRVKQLSGDLTSSVHVVTLSKLPPLPWGSGAAGCGVEWSNIQATSWVDLSGALSSVYSFWMRLLCLS